MLHTYKNGNYTVFIESDGTRTKVLDANHSAFVSKWPDNIDCKITNWCNNSYCMQYCHEQSNPHGQHGDIELGLQLFSTLPAGVEIAIGGGATQKHPQLEYFLHGLKRQKLIANLTINQRHFDNALCDKLNEWCDNNLVYGVGVSFVNHALKTHKNFTDYNTDYVWHLIAGIHTVDDLQQIIDSCINKPKILILGYKEFGNGVPYFNQNNGKVKLNLMQWYQQIHKFFNKNNIISFDNLAIKQLNIQRFFDDKSWDLFYQGDDGNANMYIDLVTKTAAVSSRSSNRINIADKSLNAAFAWVKSNSKI